jgi:DNA-binding protein Fis
VKELERWPNNWGQVTMTMISPKFQIVIPMEVRDKLTLPLEAIEALHIQRVLEACNGNRSEAAKILGIDRSTLLARLKKIHPSA